MSQEPRQEEIDSDFDKHKSPEFLLETVYEELRNVAAAKMADEHRDQTLQPTALVHEAWIRLTGKSDKKWPSRTYFFAAAAEAMRRILIEKARRKISAQNAGLAIKEEIHESQIQVNAPPDKLLSVHEALKDLEKEDPEVAKLVKLRYFIGLSMPQTAEAMDLPLRSAERLWSFGKVFLKSRIKEL